MIKTKRKLQFYGGVAKRLVLPFWNRVEDLPDHRSGTLYQKTAELNQGPGWYEVLTEVSVWARVSPMIRPVYQTALQPDVG